MAGPFVSLVFSSARVFEDAYSTACAVSQGIAICSHDEEFKGTKLLLDC